MPKQNDMKGIQTKKPKSDKCQATDAAESNILDNEQQNVMKIMEKSLMEDEYAPIH